MSDIRKQHGENAAETSARRYQEYRTNISLQKTLLPKSTLSTQDYEERSDLSSQQSTQKSGTLNEIARSCRQCQKEAMSLRGQPLCETPNPTLAACTRWAARAKSTITQTVPEGGLIVNLNQVLAPTDKDWKATFDSKE
jgi:hypothetical protein